MNMTDASTSGQSGESDFAQDADGEMGEMGEDEVMYPTKIKTKTVRTQPPLKLRLHQTMVVV